MVTGMVEDRSRARLYDVSVASESERRYALPLLPPRSALLVGVFALVLEVSLITPWVDDAADSNSTVHFTQHGLIFIGGLIMGWALRDLRLATLFAAERR